MRPFALAVAAAILLSGCASDAPPAAGANAAWSFTALDGQTYNDTSPARNASVLFFMATWCGSCRAKAPVLATVQDEYASRGVQFFSLDFDPGESREDIVSWQSKYRQDWPHAIDEALRIQRHFDVRIQSSVVVLDGTGALVEKFGYGEVTDASLRAALERALAPQLPTSSPTSA